MESSCYLCLCSNNVENCRSKILQLSIYHHDAFIPHIYRCIYIYIYTYVFMYICIAIHVYLFMYTHILHLFVYSLFYSVDWMSKDSRRGPTVGGSMVQKGHRSERPGGLDVQRMFRSGSARFP